MLLCGIVQQKQGEKMKKHKFKIPSWFINKHLLHKVDIHYENETKRSIALLDILASKYFNIDNRKKIKKLLLKLVDVIEHLLLRLMGWK